MRRMKKPGKSIIKFGPSFRESAKQNLGWSDDEVRQLELEVIKHQRDLREGLATKREVFVMWEIIRADDEEETAKFLEEGWEPFSIDPRISSSATIVHKAMWFKRLIVDQTNIVQVARHQIFKELEEAFPEAIFRMKAYMSADQWRTFSGEV